VSAERIRKTSIASRPRYQVGSGGIVKTASSTNACRISLQHVAQCGAGGLPAAEPRRTDARARSGPREPDSRLRAAELPDLKQDDRKELVMFADTKAYSGFAVNDLQEARAFYGGTLG
jgi:hypothetical protein